MDEKVKKAAADLVRIKVEELKAAIEQANELGLKVRISTPSSAMSITQKDSAISAEITEVLTF